ncbi:hypothetical protein [Actinomadura luteofluorescens]|uniref:hypothetical protein n=1 Tax=Actinomadura luteofluorescens TaxID=46163 RepID=UPI003D8A60DD
MKLRRNKSTKTSRSFTDGQKVWFQHEDYGWLPGKVVRPTSPDHTHYFIDIEGDPLRSCEVPSAAIKRYED